MCVTCWVLVGSVPVGEKSQGRDATKREIIQDLATRGGFYSRGTVRHPEGRHIFEAGLIGSGMRGL